MKLSLDWLFDHINADWRTLDILHVVDRFNRITAEIEGFYKISHDFTTISLVEVTACTPENVTVRSAEWQKDFTLSFRSDARVGDLFLIKKEGEAVAWSTFAHFDLDKAGLLPAVSCAADQRAGLWKQQLAAEDYIIEVDNKSITNRPDMWGHRGFAREVAAIIGASLKPLTDFVVEKKVASAGTGSAMSPQIAASRACSQLATLSIANVQSAPSTLFMLHRLLKVGSKPINALVDATNYVMQDIGHPMHAFDAEKITGNQLVARMAHAQEPLELLDGQKIELTTDDVIIADARGALALAGIMGGAHSAVSAATKSLIIEAACFDAGTIRRSAVHHKLRTEASARFEKSLAPENARIALMRYVKILQDAQIAGDAADTIFAAGALPQPIQLTIEHAFFEQRIGTAIAQDMIIKTLTALDFVVNVQGAAYVITVPAVRATKDVTIPEDVVEEIARFFGYENIAPQLPTREMHPMALHATMRVREIKRLMAYGMQMREQYNYSFFDEDFLRQIAWQPEHTIGVLSAVSENWQRLVTTLVPQLIDNVVRTAHEADSLRFFEWARVWHKHANSVVEQRRLAAIIFEKKKPVDFYAAKELLNQLWDALGITVTWHQVTAPQQPWFMPYQTAILKFGEQEIGVAGLVADYFLQQVTPGSAFVVELDGEFLLNHQAAIIKYAAPSKYPAVARDISMLIARGMSFDVLTAAIKSVDSLIGDVELVDLFEKDAWPDQKSVTVRVMMQATDKTLTSGEVDAVMERVYGTLKMLGAEIR